MPFERAGTTYLISADWTVIDPYYSGELTWAGGNIQYTATGDKNDGISGGSVEFTVAGSYRLTGALSETIELINTSGGAVTVEIPVGASIVNTGPSITITTPVENCAVVAASILDGSRCYLYNVTQDSTIDNSIVSGGSGYSIIVNLGAGKPANSNDIISLKICKQSGVNAWTPLVLGGVMTSGGIIFIETQEIDARHDNYGVDGSTVTELAADFANIQIDISDPDGVFDSRRAIAWWRYICQTELGIAQYNPFAINYNPDIRNILVDGPLQIENVSANTLKIVEGLWTRLDGQGLIAATSNTIHWIPDDRVYQGPETGVSGLTSGESTKLLSLPANPVLTDDARLDDIANKPTLMEIEASAILAKEATTASRLADADYTAPDNAGIASNPTLAEIEASTVLAKESTVASRLAGSSYTAPDNAGISSANTKIDTLNDLSSAEVQVLTDGIPSDVLAAAQANPIHSDSKKLNGAVVVGSGGASDKWRGQ